MLLSPCCKSPIVCGSVREYPLGRKSWYETYKIDICERCGKEVEEALEGCEMCGEPECKLHIGG